MYDVLPFIKTDKKDLNHSFSYEVYNIYGVFITNC